LAFHEIEKTAGGNTVRIKRQLTEQAIGHAAAGSWAEAAETNRKVLELGPDAETENRLAKALWEMGELGDAREHYQIALALDPTNRIAERNIERLRVLMSEAGDKNAAPEKAEKAAVTIFV
jgi:Flp pilus assembly protein TadD